MSRAVSAQYDVPCPVCLAKPKEPCRSRTTRRVTDTHYSRIELAYAPRHRDSRVGEWGGD